MLNILKKKKALGFCLAIILVLVGFYHTHKPLPEGLDYSSGPYALTDKDLEFLFDLTFQSASGSQAVVEQEIFDRVFEVISQAQKYILADMFLFNSYAAKAGEAYRPLAQELTAALIEKKIENPEIKIDLITDPINTVYGGGESKQINQLKSAGINVVITDLRKLRDSNFLYSSFWRTFFQWFGNTKQSGWLKHPFSSAEKEVTLRSYLSLLNFKANHRKVLVADSGQEYVSVVSSANPHNGSSAHSNVAFLAKGGLAQGIYITASQVAQMSGQALSPMPDLAPDKEFGQTGSTSVFLLTESKIKQALLSELKSLSGGEKARIAQFYLADRAVVSELLSASGRGVEIEIILDPNKDAFGYEKNGVPNRPVAAELTKKSEGRIKVRWYNTQGEQFHVKMALFEKKTKSKVLLGSANLTRRNLDNLNLEMDLAVEFSRESELAREISAYFKRLWNNAGGAYTLPYAAYQDDSWFKTVLYRIQERTGLSSF